LVPFFPFPQTSFSPPTYLPTPLNHSSLSITTLTLSFLPDQLSLWQSQGFLLAVTAVLHRNSAGFNIFPSIGRSLSSPERRWSAVGMGSFSSWRTNAFQCSFTDGAQGLVGVHPAPVKTVTRMREKLSK
jgi:hypothetical protein